MDLVNDEDVTGGDGYSFTAETGRILSRRSFFLTAIPKLHLHAFMYCQSRPIDKAMDLLINGPLHPWHLLVLT